MQVTDTFLYLILLLWALVIFMGGWVERYDWRHDHKEVPVYYANGHIEVIYTICGDTAKVHSNGLHGKLDDRLKNVMFSEHKEITENRD